MYTRILLTTAAMTAVCFGLQPDLATVDATRISKSDSESIYARGENECKDILGLTTCGAEATCVGNNCDGNTFNPFDECIEGILEFCEENSSNESEYEDCVDEYSVECLEEADENRQACGNAIPTSKINLMQAYRPVITEQESSNFEDVEINETQCQVWCACASYCLHIEKIHGLNIPPTFVWECQTSGDCAATEDVKAKESSTAGECPEPPGE